MPNFFSFARLTIEAETLCRSCSPADGCEAITGRNVVGRELVVRFHAERLHRGQILPEPYPDAVVYDATEILQKRDDLLGRGIVLPY
jgi:hypothetical protein